METLPEECPICNKETKNILLHIRKKKSCSSKVDPVLYDHWKEEANKRKKKKYRIAGKHKKDQAKYVQSGKHKKVQAKYVLSGKHKKVQEKYVLTGKHKEAQSKYVNTGKHAQAQANYERKFIFHTREQEKYDQRKSYLLSKSKNQARYLNRVKINSGEYDRNKRLADFKKLCLESLWQLKNHSIYHANFNFKMNKFHYVEADLVPDMLEIEDDEKFDWVKEFTVGLFSQVLTYQQIVLTTNAKWNRAIREVNSVESKKHLKDQLYKLIGKLQANDRYPDSPLWKNNFTNLVIPEEYKVTIKEKEGWSRPETLSKENELELEKLLDELFGENDENDEYEFLELLGFSNFLKKLDTALIYTKFD